AEDGIRDDLVTGVQTCALPIFRREAERQIASTRALDGCNIRVTCYKGVLRVSGSVQSELQVDAARNVLRGIEGVRSLKLELSLRSEERRVGRGCGSRQRTPAGQ